MKVCGWVKTGHSLVNQLLMFAKKCQEIRSESSYAVIIQHYNISYDPQMF